MASLYITEYAELAPVPGGGLVQAPKEPAITTQKVAIGGTTTPSAAFNERTRFVRLHTDAICSVKFSVAKQATDPAATASDARLAADQTEFFAVEPAAKVAVISNT